MTKIYIFFSITKCAKIKETQELMELKYADIPDHFKVCQFLTKRKQCNKKCKKNYHVSVTHVRC